MQLRAVACAAMLVAPGIAAAQLPLPSLQPAPPLNGLYIGAGAGFNWLQNQHLIAYPQRSIQPWPVTPQRQKYARHLERGIGIVIK
jgi:hypothetical protein